MDARAAARRPPSCASARSSISAWRAAASTGISLLSELRKAAAEGATGFYDEERWEGLRVAEGSATVALRMGAELGDRVRFGCPVTRVDVAPGGCAVSLPGGERMYAEAVVCALPVGPLRSVRIRGVSDARLASLHGQRHGLAAKVVVSYPTSVWSEAGADGTSYGEGLLGSTWPQGDGVLSMLVGPERLGLLLGAPDTAAVFEDVARELRTLFGPAAGAPETMHVRRWGTDPWTLGYITHWRPGDVMAVGPLHGTHEPPFYVCGLRPVGRGLHGGRRAHRPRRGRGGARRRRRRGGLRAAQGCSRKPMTVRRRPSSARRSRVTQVG